VPLPAWAAAIGQTGNNNAVGGLLGALGGRHDGVRSGTLLGQLGIALLPAIVFAIAMGLTYRAVTTLEQQDMTGVEQMGEGIESFSESGAAGSGDLAEPPTEGGLAEPPGSGDLAEPPSEEKQTETPAVPAPAAPVDNAPAAKTDVAAEEAADSKPAPMSFWIVLAVGALALAVFYAIFSFTRLEIFKMLLGSFFPLAMLIMAVLGAIVFGLATPTEAAAMGSLGGLLLAAAYKRLNFTVLKESVFLTAKTSAMVCWLFVGSSIFSAAFALLGGQEIINNWVLSLDMTPLQFMILAQVIIFLLGWPLEWTEIIVIFMPIFIPLLAHFNVDPLFFGLLVALNLQTAFLSPPVAMAAFYLKGVSPPQVTLNQIFLGMLPFMAIQVLALILLYTFPAIGMWLPDLLYK